LTKGPPNLLVKDDPELRACTDNIADKSVWDLSSLRSSLFRTAYDRESSISSPILESPLRLCSPLLQPSSSGWIFFALDRFSDNMSLPPQYTYNTAAHSAAAVQSQGSTAPTSFQQGMFRFVSPIGRLALRQLIKSRARATQVAVQIGVEPLVRLCRLATKALIMRRRSSVPPVGRWQSAIWSAS
jgi:hypothetical protein